VHEWKFEDNTVDSSGSGNDGITTGDITYEAGKFGQAVVIDAANDLIENSAANGLPLGATDAWSMNVWLKVTDFPSLGYAAGFGGRLDDSASGSKRAYLSFSNVGADQSNNYYFWGSSRDVESGETYDAGDGNWHMYTTTYDGTNVSMYKDANLVISEPRELIDAPNIVSVGNPSNWDSSINASVDEFTIWSGTLGSSAIQSLLTTNTVPEPTGLLPLMFALAFVVRSRRRRDQ
jgi:hypothetical protein